MKQYVKSSRDILVASDYIDDITLYASNQGYNTAFNADSLEFEFTPKTDERRMPIVTAYGDDSLDEEVMWFVPSMRFPKELSDLDFADSYEYYMESWLKASKICTYLNDHPYRLEV